MLPCIYLSSDRSISCPDDKANDAANKIPSECVLIIHAEADTRENWDIVLEAIRKSVMAWDVSTLFVFRYSIPDRIIAQGKSAMS